jgi:hypothetical protein
MGYPFWMDGVGRSSHNLNAIAGDPKFQLLQPVSPALLESLDPLQVCFCVRHIHNYLYQIVLLHDPGMAPVSLDLLSLIAGCAELFHNLQNRFREPVSGNFSPVVKAKG